MSINFPLDLPTVSGIRKSTWTIRTATSRQRSPFSFKSHSQDFGGDMWIVSVELAPMKLEAANQWASFLAALKGNNGTFYLSDPMRATPSGVATGSPVINGSGQSGRTLFTRGWSPSITGILKAGDFIQISNHLYMITRDVNSNGLGFATLEIAPSLREHYPNAHPIIVNNCKGVFALVSPTVSIFEADFQKFHTINFLAEEVF